MAACKATPYMTYRRADVLLFGGRLKDSASVALLWQFQAVVLWRSADTAIIPPTLREYYLQ